MEKELAEITAKYVEKSISSIPADSDIAKTVPKLRTQNGVGSGSASGMKAAAKKGTPKAVTD